MSVQRVQPRIYLVPYTKFCSLAVTLTKWPNYGGKHKGKRWFSAVLLKKINVPLNIGTCIFVCITSKIVTKQIFLHKERTVDVLQSILLPVNGKNLPRCKSADRKFRLAVCYVRALWKKAASLSILHGSSSSSERANVHETGFTLRSPSWKGPEKYLI